MHLIESNFTFSPGVIEKLQNKHKVSELEVMECFYSRDQQTLIDTREKNKTRPPTHWFVSQTDKGRTLRVAFMILDGKICIKTAHPASKRQQQLYRKEIDR